ncbi:hypothetical protein CP995_29315, partial [Klebsiella pneumoniae]
MAIHLPPALRQHCDLDTLQLESASFIEESLRAWYSDVLWSLKTASGEGYIYVVIEHQSSPDAQMAFRLMRTPSPRCMSGTCLMAAPPSKRSPPTVDEMRKRIQTVRDNGLPWLVALWRGAIVGYCYATFYRPRPAYSLHPRGIDIRGIRNGRTRH